MDRDSSDQPFEPLDRNQERLFSNLGKVLPERPDYKTVWTWCKKGLLSISGKREKLRYVRLPTGMATSLVRYDEWIVRLNKLPGRPVETDRRTPKSLL